MDEKKKEDITNEETKNMKETGEIEEIKELSENELENIGGGKTKTVTKLREETRTRTVYRTRTVEYTVKGKRVTRKIQYPVEEEYTVMVPYKVVIKCK